MDSKTPVIPKPVVPDAAYKSVIANDRKWWVIASLAYLVSALFLSATYVSILPLTFWVLTLAAGLAAFKISESKKVL